MIRIGIVGCGRILAAHLRGYRLLRAAGVDDFRITALCARNADDARMYVRRGEGPPQRPAVSQIPGDPLAIGDEYLSDFQPDTPVEIFTDYREMIARGPIDAVNDFSTHGLHYDVALRSFAAGKHVLSQKPLAGTVAAARRMVDAATRTGRVFAVFENFRFSPRTRHLKWLFDSGLGGAPQMVLLGYAGVWWAPDRIVANTPWRHQAAEAGGISLDLGVHFFDQIRHVCGEIESVSAQTAVLEPVRVRVDASGQVVERIACDADDTFLAAIRTRAGVVGQLFASWAGHGGPTLVDQGTVYHGTRVRAAGDQVTFDDGAAASLAELYAAQAPAARQAIEFPLGLTNDFALSQLDWLAAIRDGRRPETDGEAGLRDLAAAWAILESARARCEVAVEDVTTGRLREAQRPLDAALGLA